MWWILAIVLVGLILILGRISVQRAGRPLTSRRKNRQSSSYSEDSGDIGDWFSGGDSDGGD